MADLDITQNNFSNLNVTVPGTGKASAGQQDFTASITALRAYLSGKGYTAVQMNAMTKNDLVYAARMVSGFDTYKSVTSIALTGTQTCTVGGTQTFTATATYEDGTTASVNASSESTFGSTNTAAATVSNSGVITGVAAGGSSIYCTYRGQVSVPRHVQVS